MRGSVSVLDDDAWRLVGDDGAEGRKEDKTMHVANCYQKKMHVAKSYERLLPVPAGGSRSKNVASGGRSSCTLTGTAPMNHGALASHHHGIVRCDQVLWFENMDSCRELV